MSFDWKEFYDVGVHLERHSSKNLPTLRVRRYYYSYYHCVKNYFEKKYFNLGHQESPHQT